MLYKSPFKRYNSVIFFFIQSEIAAISATISFSTFPHVKKSLDPSATILSPNSLSKHQSASFSTKLLTLDTSYNGITEHVTDFFHSA